MKRMLTSAMLLAATLFAISALAATPAAQGKAAAKAAVTASPPSVTVRGEIVEAGCYMSHGATGEKHKSCATKCLAAGQPMGLLTSDGTLYLLTQNHRNADPFNQCKTWVSATVEVTGPSFERSGMKALEVESAKPVAAAAATK